MAIIPPPTRVRVPGRDYSEGATLTGVNPIAVIAAITGVLLLPVPIVSLLFGGIAMGQIRRSRETGLTLAAVGLVLGAIGSAAWLAFWLVVLFTKGVTVTLPI